MPMLTKDNQGRMHEKLYAGWLQGPVTLIHRNDDLQQGTTTSYTLFNVWAKRIHHNGEPIQGSMGVGDTRGWLIPVAELNRVGVNYINALDVFVDDQGRHWQPESPDMITLQLGENYYDIGTKRIA